MKKNGLPFWLLLGVLLILSAIGVWKTVYVNADIDESYALTMAGRIVNGDQLFVTMWEPHQLSALLYAPFLGIYKSVVGSFTGALIFMRWIGIAIQFFVSIVVFFVLQEEFGKSKALLLAGLYFNFTPKHIQSPEFTSLSYWFVMLLILGFIQYRKKKKYLFLILSAVCMSALVLCYPAMLLTFLVVLVWLTMKKDKAGAIVWTAVCGVCGLVCVGYLCLQAGGWQQIVENIPNVLSDASHSQNLGQMFQNHVAAFWQMSKLILPTLVILQVGRPVLDRNNKHALSVLALVSVVQTIWSIWQFHTIVKVNFQIIYPIVFQFFLIGFYAYGWFAHSKEKKEFFEVAAIVNGSALLAILFSSNLDASILVSFLMPATLFGLAMLLDVQNEKSDKVERREKIAKCFVWLTIFVFVIQLFAVRILLVRYTAMQRRNLFAEYYETNVGSLKGVSLSSLDYRQYESKYNTLCQYVTKDDVFLFVGCDMFLYTSLLGGQIGTGNTISTPAFSTQLMHYYELHPDRIPTVVFVDRIYGADFRTVLQSSPFREFMESHFDLEHPITDGPLDVYVR